MKKETFGSDIQYKMLDYIVEKIEMLDRENRKLISSFIHEFNGVIKKTNNISDVEFRNYILDLIYRDFIKRIEKDVSKKYDAKLIGYLKNFINARIKDSKTKF